MHPDSPPPLPKPPRLSLSRRSKLVIGLALVPALLFGALILLRICGLLRPFNVPSAAMTPAVSAGDHVLMEGITFLYRQPLRGEIIVFKADGIALLPPGEFYIKRVAGEPGDRVRISDGKLFVNEKQVSLSNAVGAVFYDPPPGNTFSTPRPDVMVPDACYFVLGDNSTNSLDSRFYGSIPRSRIIGRISFCYWPPQRIGGVK
jgi:signal peptidase I